LLRTKLKKAAAASHIWWGVSVENKSHGLARIDWLRKAKPAVAFLSIEPLIEDLGEFSLKDIHWAIVGGESGPGARPLEKAWVRHIRAQCRAQKVPFFFKQWGGVRKAENGRTLDGRTYSEFPKTEVSPVASSARRARLLDELIPA
jgi:protein gp37